MNQEILLNGMKEAMSEARMATKMGEFPYGAVIINAKGIIVSKAQDLVVRNTDVTKHAEIEAVRAAVAKLGSDLNGCALVSNIEPCAMCSTAAWWARISIIAYGLSQDELYALNPNSMDEPGLTVEEALCKFKRKVEIISGLLYGENLSLWKIF